MRIARRRFVARSSGGASGTRCISEGERTEEVPGGVRPAGAGVVRVCVELVQRADAQVEPGAPRRGHGLVHRIPVQRMCEHELVDPVLGRDEPRVDGGLDTPQGVAHGPVDDGGHELEREVAADDRCGTQHRLRQLGHPAEPSPHEAHDVLGRDVVNRGVGIELELLEHLDEAQRVSGADVHQRGGVGTPADPAVRGREHVDERLGLGLVERCEREVEVGIPEPGPPRPNGEERAARVHVGAVRAEDHELATRRAQHVLEQRDRVLTGPVEVLDHHDPRTVRLGQHSGDGVEQPGPTGAGLRRRHRRGEHRGQLGGQAGQLGQHRGRRRRHRSRADDGVDELRERLIGVAVPEALTLDHLGLGVIGDESADDGRLADPGDAGHVRELRAAVRAAW